METELKKLIGKIVKKVFINNEFLRFETDNGKFTYTVVGDCCSYSFFYDFYGVKNLLNHKIKEIKEVELHPTDLFVVPDKGDSTAVYGYSITLEPNEDDYYGESTAVFSFRNESNGYYGGWITESDFNGDIKEILDDAVEVEDKIIEEN